MNRESSLQSLNNGKPVIGFVCSGLSELGKEIWAGAQKCAEDKGIRIIAYVGDVVENKEDDARPGANIAFGVPKSDVIDGAVVYTGSVGQFCTIEKTIAILQGFGDMPLVNLALPIPGYPTVMVDNYSGIYDVVLHLHRNNNRTKIAFIKGPDGHPEAEERFQAYKEGLKECGLPYDPQLVAPGEFSPESGVEGVSLFLDQRRVKPDAIACVDDDTAFGVMESLKGRGISIPEDIAVTGFDDIEEASAVDPPMTTVRQPLDKTGYVAVEALLNKLEGLPVEQKINVPTELVVRNSCGSSGFQSALPQVQSSGQYSLKGHMKELVAKVANKVKNDHLSVEPDQLEDLMESLGGDVMGQSESLFVRQLGKTIHKMEENEQNLSSLHGALTAMRHQLIIHISEEERSQVEELFQQARVMVHEASQRHDLMTRLDAQHEFSQWSSVIQGLNGASSREELWRLLERSLVDLGVNSCYLFLYNNPLNPLESANNIFSFSQGRRAQPIPDLAVSQLVPPAVFRQEQGHCYAYEPLYFGEEQLGYGFFQFEPEKGEFCDTLSWQISSVLKRLILMEQKDVEDQMLRTRNQQISNLVTPMLDSISLINQMAHEKSSVMEELRGLIHKNSLQMEDIKRTTQQITSDTRRMLEIVKVIDDIAESVNVLAINASIESSHAGELGRGFAVIAKEIRRLSDSTSENSNSISTLLKQSAGNVEQFNASSDQNRQSFELIEQRAEEFLEFFGSLTQRMENLSQNSSDILQLMDRD